MKRRGRLLGKFRLGLGLRIYAVGLLQFAVVAAGIAVIAEASRPARTPRLFNYIAETVLKQTTRDGVIQEVNRVNSSLRGAIALVDDRGRLIAGTLPVADDAASDTAKREFAAVTVALNSGEKWRLVGAPPPRPSPPGLAYVVTMILLVVSVSSWLVARSLVLPLRKLSAAARAFGGGDLASRSSMKRSDELGDVAEAFDQMAERVTRTLHAEKELLANVSHELRTPLQRIRAALDLAAESDGTTARESLSEIAQDLNELEHIVSDVLTTARLYLVQGAGGSSALPPVRREPCDLAVLIEKSAARFRSLYPERTLAVTIAKTLPILAADVVLLRRALDNLLDNAHKYGGEPSMEMSLRASVVDETLLIEVEDHGIGVAAEDLTRIFEPFFRADRSRTRATGGLGLGLLLARRIVEAHAGALRLESTPGVGTIARIRLPIASKAAAS